MRESCLASPGKLEFLTTLDDFLESQNGDYGNGASSEVQDMINEVDADGKGDAQLEEHSFDMTNLGEKLTDEEVKGSAYRGEHEESSKGKFVVSC